MAASHAPTPPNISLKEEWIRATTETSTINSKCNASSTSKKKQRTFFSFKTSDFALGKTLYIMNMSSIRLACFLHWLLSKNGASFITHQSYSMRFEHALQSLMMEDKELDIPSIFNMFYALKGGVTILDLDHEAVSPRGPKSYAPLHQPTEFNSRICTFENLIRLVWTSYGVLSPCIASLYDETPRNHTSSSSGTSGSSVKDPEMQLGLDDAEKHLVRLNMNYNFFSFRSFNSDTYQIDWEKFIDSNYLDKVSLRVLRTPCVYYAFLMPHMVLKDLEQMIKAKQQRRFHKDLFTKYDRLNDKDCDQCKEEQKQPIPVRRRSSLSNCTYASESSGLSPTQLTTHKSSPELTVIDNDLTSPERWGQRTPSPDKGADRIKSLKEVVDSTSALSSFEMDLHTALSPREPEEVNDRHDSPPIESTCILHQTAPDAPNWDFMLLTMQKMIKAHDVKLSIVGYNDDHENTRILHEQPEDENDYGTRWKNMAWEPEEMANRMLTKYEMFFIYSTGYTFAEKSEVMYYQLQTKHNTLFKCPVRCLVSPHIKFDENNHPAYGIHLMTENTKHYRSNKSFDGCQFDPFSIGITEEQIHQRFEAHLKQRFDDYAKVINHKHQVASLATTVFYNPFLDHGNLQFFTKKSFVEPPLPFNKQNTHECDAFMTGQAAKLCYSFWFCYHFDKIVEEDCLKLISYMRHLFHPINISYNFQLCPLLYPFTNAVVAGLVELLDGFLKDRHKMEAEASQTQQGNASIVPPAKSVEFISPQKLEQIMVKMFSFMYEPEVLFKMFRGPKNKSKRDKFNQATPKTIEELEKITKLKLIDYIRQAAFTDHMRIWYTRWMYHLTALKTFLDTKRL